MGELTFKSDGLSKIQVEKNKSDSLFYFNNKIKYVVLEENIIYTTYGKSIENNYNYTRLFVLRLFDYDINNSIKINFYPLNLSIDRVDYQNYSVKKRELKRFEHR